MSISTNKQKARKNEGVKSIKIAIAITLLTTLILSSCSKDDGNDFMASASDIAAIIDENPSNGTTIGTVATNLTGSLNYSITSQSVANALTINNTTGEVTVNDMSKFDFETNPSLTAMVTVTNSSETATSMVLVTLNNVDDIAFFLSTSKTAYEQANAGDWVEITLNEYDTLSESLNNVGTVGNSDTQFTYTNVLQSGGGPWTLANVTPATMVSNSYAFAFKYYLVSGTNVTGNRVKQSSTSNNTGYEDIGNLLPEHSGSNKEMCFVLKGNNTLTTDTGYLAITMGSGNRMGYHTSPAENGYDVGFSETATDLTTSSNGLNFLYQGLSTTQKQWD